MEQSAAERELLQLLRGQDAPEFTLQISLKDRNSHASMPGQEGWRLIESPQWTVIMMAPQAMQARTTTSVVSLADAWARQGNWWRGGRLTPHDATNEKHQTMPRADDVGRAESLFLSIARGDGGRPVIITVSVKAGCWHTNLQVPGTPGGANGKGPSFAYAWQHNLPWWEDKSLARPGRARTGARGCVVPNGAERDGWSYHHNVSACPRCSRPDARIREPMIASSTNVQEEERKTQ
jgi:hypothetical protein